ncbi:hypothetical protein MPTK1_3g20225 [Marchantia polymorpha subsp. ruderalis]
MDFVLDVEPVEEIISKIQTSLYITCA